MSGVVQAGKTHSMELIIFPLFILIFVGSISNNFASAGVQTTPTFVQSTNFGTGIVVPNSENGCDNSMSNCNITALSSYSFLNPNSPFTLIIQGNVIGFFSQLLNNGEAPNTYNTGDTLCIPMNQYGQLFNDTGSLIQGFQCYGRVADTNNAQPPSIIPVINASSNSGNNSIWNLLGCPNYQTPHVPPCGIFYTGPNAQWQQLTENAFYIKNGTVLSSGQCTVGGVTYSSCGVFWRVFFGGGTPTFTCTSTVNNLHQFGTNKTIFIAQTTYYCLIPFNSPSQTSIGSVFGFWGFIAGILLLVIGLGLGIDYSGQVLGSGVGFGFSSNSHGSRQAMVLGLFIMTWSFVYSEFGGWLTNFSGLGIGTIMFIMFAAMSFVGVYWRIFSLD